MEITVNIPTEVILEKVADSFDYHTLCGDVAERLDTNNLRGRIAEAIVNDYAFGEDLANSIEPSVFERFYESFSMSELAMEVADHMGAAEVAMNIDLDSVGESVDVGRLASRMLRRSDFMHGLAEELHPLLGDVDAFYSTRIADLNDRIEALEATNRRLTAALTYMNEVQPVGVQS